MKTLDGDDHIKRLRIYNIIGHYPISYLSDSQYEIPNSNILNLKQYIQQRKPDEIYQNKLYAESIKKEEKWLPKPYYIQARIFQKLEEKKNNFPLDFRRHKQLAYN